MNDLQKRTIDNLSHGDELLAKPRALPGGAVVLKLEAGPALLRANGNLVPLEDVEDALTDAIADLMLLRVDLDEMEREEAIEKAVALATMTAQGHFDAEARGVEPRAAT